MGIVKIFAFRAWAFARWHDNQYSSKLKRDKQNHYVSRFHLQPIVKKKHLWMRMDVACALARDSDPNVSGITSETSRSLILSQPIINVTKTFETKLYVDEYM